MVAATLQTTLASRLRFLGAEFLTPEDAPDPRAAAEYRRLFGGDKPVCPARQTEFVGDGADHEASAQGWFRRFNFQGLASSTHADHVGLLLSFAAHMVEADPSPTVLRGYAEAHLSWIAGFCELLANESHHHFYVELALSTQRAIESYLSQID